MNNRAHVSTHVPTHHGQERKGRGSVYCLSRVAWRYFVSSYNGYRMHDTPQTVVYKKGSEFPQKFLIYQLGGGYEMINLM